MPDSSQGLLLGRRGVVLLLTASRVSPPASPRSDTGTSATIPPRASGTTCNRGSDLDDSCFHGGVTALM
jgi:hypothetical protein